MKTKWKKQLILLGFLILVVLCISTEIWNNKNTNWKKSFSITTYSEATITYSQTGFLLCLPEKSDNNTGYKLVKTDLTGNTIWSKSYLNPDWEYKIASIASTSDDGYILCGESSSEIVSQVLYISKMTSTGTEEWHRIYGASSGGCIGRDIVARADSNPFRGGYFAVGNSGNVSENYPNIYLVRLFQDGGAFYNKELEMMSGVWVEALCFSEDHFIVAGTMYAGSGDNTAIWVSELNHLGNVVWEKTIEGPDSYIASDIVVTSSGAFIVVGSSQSEGVGGSSFFAVKLDSEGREVWRRIYDSSSYDVCNSVLAASDGGYMLVGGSGGDIKVVKTDSRGDVLWCRVFRTVFSWDEGFWVFEVDSGRIVIGGFTKFLSFFPSLILFELN